MTRAMDNSALSGAACRRRTSGKTGWARPALHAIPYDSVVLADARRIAHGPQPSCFRNRCHTELANGYDGYTGIIPKSAGTVSEILRQNGYATGWIERTTTRRRGDQRVGPFDHWPSGLVRLFLRLNSGDTSQFEPC